jgi:putative ABC transport system permease protein
MLRYYTGLALLSLRRNFVLSTLMVLSIGLGVALTMTAYTILYVLSRDPIPSKSQQLFAVQIDNGGPRSRKPGDLEPPSQMSWLDASALLRIHQGARETAMYEVGVTIVPEAPAQEFQSFGRATTSDFFGMFQVPLMFGSAWSRLDDTTAASVVVITKRLNDRLFGGKNSVGSSIRFNDGTYRIVGVLGNWDPKPRFYDVIGGMSFEEGEQLYLPLSISIRKGWETVEYEYCNAGSRGKTFEDLTRSECVWLQYWVELPTAAQVEKYRTLLFNYSREQQRIGRFTWGPNIRLRNVRDWLVAQKVVPDDAEMSVAVAFAFFLCCVVSAFALMLGKALARAEEFGVRRAMGASSLAIFYQTLVEAALVGVLGGALGT